MKLSIVNSLCALLYFSGHTLARSVPRIGIDCQGYGSACTKEYRPICGSDDVTYENECLFCAAKRENGWGILVGHRGACTEWGGMEEELKYWSSD
ncbi:ovomucoid-like [Clupea harengus]|uniref:Ovomucoid-like n=1 Tax=Clupea harengus TaxID=7950 RepID=A0A6P8ETG1_CLUHA|nr:ovomucoid-like [Clupea harengus]